MLKSFAHDEHHHDAFHYHHQGVAKAAKLLQSAFDHFEPAIQVGLIPQQFKKQFAQWLTLRGAEILEKDVAFCRHGYLHPPSIDLSPLVAGEAFTVDAWLRLDGWYADMARPYCLSPIKEPLAQLKRAAVACNLAAQKAAHVGNNFFNIVESVQYTAQQYNCHIIDEAFGHGIGRRLHQEPEVAFSSSGRFLFSPLKAGMIITIEPALTLVKSSLILNNKGEAYTNTGALALFAESIIAIDQHQTYLLSS